MYLVCSLFKRFCIYTWDEEEDEEEEEKEKEEEKEEHMMKKSLTKQKV